MKGNNFIHVLIVMIFSSQCIQAQDLFDDSVVRDLRIDFYDDNYDAFLNQSWEEETKLRLPAKINFDGILLDSVATRYKGNSTYFIPRDGGNPKLPWNLDMNDLIDQELLGYNKVKLANGMFDPSMIREVMSYDIYRTYMPAPRANHLNVFVEDEYLGVYINTESINRQFLKRHFDENDGAFFKCDPTSQFGGAEAFLPPDLFWYGSDTSEYLKRYELKSDLGWQELVGLIDVLNNDPGNLESVLNIDRFLWYAAVSNCVANLDSYTGLYVHNYYLYKTEDGLWQFIPWDASESFIGILLNNQFVSREEMYNWNPLLEIGPLGVPRPMLEYVADHPVYRKQYFAHIKTILEESIIEEQLRSRGQSLHEVIGADMENDNNAFFQFGDLFMESNLEQNTDLVFLAVAGIINTALTRKDRLLNLPDLKFDFPEIIAFESIEGTVDQDELVKFTGIVENANQVELRYSTNGLASHFTSISSSVSNDGSFSITMPSFEVGTKVDYYLRVQNDSAMVLEPRKAEYEFYSYEVEEISHVNDQVERTMIIYPNPVKYDQILYVDNVPNGLDLSVSINNATGHTVQQFVLDNNELELGGLNLTSGLYFLTFELDGLLFNRRLIITE